MINQFDTEWVAFSNFAYSAFVFRGERYSTAEHAFQAMKVIGDNRERIINAKTPGEAKLLGNTFKNHPEWDKVKLSIMEEILIEKFSQNEYLAKLLVSTGDIHIEEGNNWGDVFWGTVNGEGENHLGKLLMKIREEFQNGNLSILDDDPASKYLTRNGIAKTKLNSPY